MYTVGIPYRPEDIVTHFIAKYKGIDNFFSIFVTFTVPIGYLPPCFGDFHRFLPAFRAKARDFPRPGAGRYAPLTNARGGVIIDLCERGNRAVSCRKVLP